MLKGTTKSGFFFQADEDVMNDMEMIDMLADEKVNYGIKVSHLVRKVLGEEQRKALYDHLLKENGRVPADAVEREMEEIFEAFGQQGKNS